MDPCTVTYTKTQCTQARTHTRTHAARQLARTYIPKHVRHYIKEGTKSIISWDIYYAKLQYIVEQHNDKETSELIG